jgi:hypothetical protein
MHVQELAVGPDLNSSVERLVKIGETVTSLVTRPKGVRMNLLMAEALPTTRA